MLSNHSVSTHQQCRREHSTWQQILEKGLKRRKRQTSLKIQRNFPGIRLMYYLFCFGVKNNIPKIEKNIIKPDDICTTLRLPTRVNPRSPAFSLHNHSIYSASSHWNTWQNEKEVIHKKKLAHFRLEFIIALHWCSWTSSSTEYSFEQHSDTLFQPLLASKHNFGELNH